MAAVAHYEVITASRAGKERRREYVSNVSLAAGDVFRLYGRDWLVERVEPAEGDAPTRLFAKPARYRLTLRHPEGREEVGAFRRYRPDAPKLGHAFTTLEDRRPISWEVVDEFLAHDEQGEPFLELLAERDYSELEELPDHELEHALPRRGAGLPESAAAALARAERGGLAVELVALESIEAPDWAAAESYIDSLILEEVEDDLIVLCGVDPEVDPRETWIGKVKDRLRSDLERFRGDIEGDHDQIEEWDFSDGRIFASVGSVDDEADPDSGHGWMCRLVDVGALVAAGFERVRKATLAPPD